MGKRAGTLRQKHCTREGECSSDMSKKDGIPLLEWEVPRG